MPRFIYTVQDTQGLVTTGAVESADEDQAVLLLQNKGLFILSIQQEQSMKGVPGLKRVGGMRRISGRDLVFFGEQLSTLLNGGLPLVRSLSLLAENTENKNFAMVICSVNKEVAAGGALYKALEKHPKVFDTIWISMVQAGEMSGQLPGTLKQVTSYVEAQENLKSKIITALAYPAVLFIMSVGVLSYFILFIVPVFSDIFRDFDLKLPALTRFIVFFSGFMTQHFVFLAVIVTGAVLGVRAYLSTEVGKLTWHHLQFRLPIVGNFVKNVQIERLLTTMATLIKSGVSILNTITVLENAFVSNLVIQRALKAVKNEVASGKSISASFKKTGIFPHIVTEMMWMGEESGKLPDIIGTLSKFYQDQIDQWVRRFSSLIDPILVVTVGGIIGVIVLSIFMPIFQLSKIGTAG